jgi:hypothetical protein
VTDLFVDDGMLSFSESRNVVPSLVMDFAHLDSLFAPIMVFSRTPGKKGQIANKLGAFRVLNRPRLKYLAELNRRGTCKILGATFLIRVFDSFPVKSEDLSTCASLDIRLNDVNASVRLDVTELSGKGSLASLIVSVPDVFPLRTFCVLAMQHIQAEFTDTVSLSVDQTLVHANLMVVQHLQDMFDSTASFRARFGHAPKPFRQIKSGDFPRTKSAFSLHSIQLFVTSMDTELRIIARLKDTVITQRLTPDTAKAEEAAVSLSVEEMGFSIAGFSPQNSHESPLVTVHGTSLLSSSRCHLASVRSLDAFAKPEELAAAYYLFNDCMPSDYRPKQPSVQGYDGTMKFIFSIDVLRIVCLELIQVQFDGFSGSLTSMEDSTMELALTLTMVSVTNPIADASFKEVFARNLGSARSVRPHFLVQLKMPPKLSGNYVFSQVEVNLEPSIIAYEAKFWDDFRLKFKHEYVPQLSRALGTFSIASESDLRTPLPVTLVDASVFPSPIGKSQLEMSKRAQLHRPEKEQMVATMMFRYFRLNPISLQFSYRNSDNKILSELHRFQGQLREIIYHDLSANPSELIEKLLYDIALVMIPQFLKHVVGMKRSDLTPEQAVAEWLRTDDDRMTQQEKQKMLLFGPKTTKRRWLDRD